MITAPIRLCIAALLLALPAMVTAQSEETPWYDVELIVFSHSADSAGSTENWPDNELPLNLENTIEPMPPLQTESGLTAPYSTIDESEWRLQDEFARIARTHGRVEPLIHTAWRQPVMDRKQAQGLFLRSATELAPGIPKAEGVITVSVNRYLHVELDFLLWNLLSANTADGGLFQPLQKSYRFTSHRRMRSGELHYLDHPLMGALILISRYEAPEPEIIEEPIREEGTPASAATEAADATPTTQN